MKPLLSPARTALACAVLIASCASSPPLEVRSLPYHVALVAPAGSRVGPGEPGSLPGKPTGLRLDLAEEEVAAALADALADYCFERVTVIAADGESPLDRAREAGADLVVALDLRYDPAVHRANGSSFWLGFPLFLFAGPSHWFLPDNDYFADVELTARVYDRNALEAAALSLGDPAAEVVAASASYRGAGLDFTDRADGVGDYVLGVFVPSAFLARESASSLDGVREAVLHALRADVVRSLQRQRAELLGASWIAPVWVDPDEVRLTRDGSDLVVRGVARLHAGGLAERVVSVTLEAGGERVVVRPRPDAPPGADLRFTARIPGGALAGELRLRCEAGPRDRFVRSYTFGIPVDLARERG